MTDDEIKRMQWAHARGMQAMSAEQMAERARQQQAGMMNAGVDYSSQANNLRNMWGPDAADLSMIGPDQLPPLTLKQRITQWLSRFWGRT